MSFGQINFKKDTLKKKERKLRQKNCVFIVDENFIGLHYLLCCVTVRSLYFIRIFIIMKAKQNFSL